MTKKQITAKQIMSNFYVQIRHNEHVDIVRRTTAEKYLRKFRAEDKRRIEEGRELATEQELNNLK